MTAEHPGETRTLENKSTGDPCSREAIFPTRKCLIRWGFEIGAQYSWECLGDLAACANRHSPFLNQYCRGMNTGGE